MLTRNASSGHFYFVYPSLLSLPSRTTGTGYDMTNLPKLHVCHVLHRLLINNLKQKHTKQNTPKIFSFLFFFFFDRNKTKYNYTRVASRKRLILSLSPTSSKSNLHIKVGSPPSSFQAYQGQTPPNQIKSCLALLPF